MAELRTVDPDEVKDFTFREFMSAMRSTGIISVIKFWSLVQAGIREIPAGTVEEVVDLGSDIVRQLSRGMSRASLLEQIRQADADSGQQTDISWLVKEGE